MRAIAIAAFLASSVPAAAPRPWLRVSYEDAVVVERSEVIVEARLRPESVKEKKHAGKGSWENQGTLTVTAVHKGKLDAKEIPVIIHYGLDPKVTPAGTIELWDTGNSAVSSRPLLTDIGKDHLWFLRKRGGQYGEKPGAGTFGIVDPEDVRILDLKEYLLAYLADDAEKAVRAIVEKRPELRKDAERYFDQMEIQRIQKVEDPAARARKLLPYFVKLHYWNGERTARKALVAIGAPADAALREIYDDPKHDNLREEIIETWGNLAYQPAAKILTTLLRDQDKYWASQELKGNWWNENPESDLTRARWENYALVYSSVRALRQIGDPRAREAVELTRKRWVEIIRGTQFGNNQIVDECDAALQELPDRK